MNLKTNKLFENYASPEIPLTATAYSTTTTNTDREIEILANRINTLKEKITSRSKSYNKDSSSLQFNNIDSDPTSKDQPISPTLSPLKSIESPTSQFYEENSNRIPTKNYYLNSENQNPQKQQPFMKRKGDSNDHQDLEKRVKLLELELENQRSLSIRYENELHSMSEILRTKDNLKQKVEILEQSLKEKECELERRRQAHVHQLDAIKKIVIERDYYKSHCLEACEKYKHILAQLRSDNTSLKVEVQDYIKHIGNTFQLTMKEINTILDKTSESPSLHKHESKNNSFQHKKSTKKF